MHVLVLLVALLMVAFATIESFCQKVYNEAAKKAAELQKKGGNNE